MKTIISILCLFLINLLTSGQNIIHFDTTVNKTINANESFELKFLDWPGTGYSWYLPEICDSSKIIIKLLKKEVMTGYGAIGGKWVSTYTYCGLVKGTYQLEYYYGRSWIKEKINKCTLNLKIK